MTPLFFHPHQDVVQPRISTTKIPEFVRQTRTPCIIPELLAAEDLHRVHDRRYVDGVFLGEISNGFDNRDAEINRSILASNSNFVAGARRAMTEGVACSATQGFHHAGYDSGYGYCTFNGLMLAARLLLDEGAVKRVLIIDGDGHHGDGTDDIIEKLGLIDRVTNHTSRSMGARYDTGGLGSAADWKAYTDDLIREFEPGIIMYQAGADAWVDDPYGAGYLNLLDMKRRDLGIMTAAKVAGIPLVWNLAGGYSQPMQKVIDIHLSTFTVSDWVYYGNSRSE